MVNYFLALIVSSILVLVTAFALATTPDKPGALPDNAVLLYALRSDAPVVPTGSPKTATSPSCSRSSQQKSSTITC